MPVHDLVAIVSVVGATLGNVLAALQNSRCTRISACGASCERAVADGERRVAVADGGDGGAAREGA